MAAFTVTTSTDIVDANDGVLSLREAVVQANATAAADTIQFANALEGQTLTLTGGELVLRQDVTIDGDGNDDGVEVTISGDDAQRILRTSGITTDVAVVDLTLEQGHAIDGGKGGAIFHESASLNLVGCTIRDNKTEHGNGGAIFASGTGLNIADSLLTANQSQYGNGGAIYADPGANIVITGSVISNNHAHNGYYGGGIRGTQITLDIRDSRIEENGNSAIYLDDSDFSLQGSMLIHNEAGVDAATGAALSLNGGVSVVDSSTIAYNTGYWRGAVSSTNGNLQITNSTLANNVAMGVVDSNGDIHGGVGGAIYSLAGILSVINTTLTGNSALTPDFGDHVVRYGVGGAIEATFSELEVANVCIVGNRAEVPSGEYQDIIGSIAVSNGHNLFGSDVLANVSGDRENVAAASIFAAIDPETGGGLLAASGIVPLWSSASNPALSGADPLAASATGQLGTTGRPLPAGSLPDLGSIEINQPLSTTSSNNNDVLTGTAAGDSINGLAGADFIKGLGGNDTLRGGDGGDLLDGGAGNDKLYGDAGIDLVFYGGSTKVTVDLSLATDKATRGSETDTLYNVEGAIGSSAADSFKGNEYNNFFQGGLGKDTATGGGGRDLYDFNAVADSKAGATTRDVITDFDHLVDKIDLMGLDADATVAGNQAFRWVGTAALGGPGEVGFFTSGSTTIIRGSTDADAASEFEIQLTGIKPLTAVDFYL